MTPQYTHLHPLTTFANTQEVDQVFSAFIGRSNSPRGSEAELGFARPIQVGNLQGLVFRVSLML